MCRRSAYISAIRLDLDNSVCDESSLAFQTAHGLVRWDLARCVFWDGKNASALIHEKLYMHLADHGIDSLGTCTAKLIARRPSTGRSGIEIQQGV